MKIRKIISFVMLTAFLIAVSFPLDALACACCAEPGTYSISVRKFDKYELGELAKIRFGTANLFMTAAGEDAIKGISLLGETYSPDGLFKNNAWKINLKDQKGASGTLMLPMAVSAVLFAVDIHDGRGSADNPLLYKEWRFKYRVQSGTGIFQKGIAPATEYFLVLQGRGNMCTQAEDFTHWKLEVTGKKASYAFYGKLSSGKTAAR